MFNTILPQLMVCLCLLGGGHFLWGQTIRSATDTLSLNFGYPSLKAEDDLMFKDENGNSQIDPSEGCVITFTLLNESHYPARDVLIRPKELNGLEGVMLPEKVKVGSIEANKSRKVEVNIIAGDSLDQGTANFAFSILEGNAVQSATVIFSVQANQPEGSVSAPQTKENENGHTPNIAPSDDASEEEKASTEKETPQSEQKPEESKEMTEQPSAADPEIPEEKGEQGDSTATPAVDEPNAEAVSTNRGDEASPKEDKSDGSAPDEEKGETPKSQGAESPKSTGDPKSSSPRDSTITPVQPDQGSSSVSDTSQTSIPLPTSARKDDR